MSLDSNNAIKHIAIIMDGNGRWAKSRLKPRIFGHRSSISSVDAAIEYCVSNKIEVLTLFAFGRDNWSRPKKEVDDLMNLFYKTLNDKLPKLNKNNVVLTVIGDRTRLSSKLLGKIEECEDVTADNTGLKLRLAVDFSGKWDIVETVKKIAENVQKGDISLDDIDENLFADNIGAGKIDVDLLIRTSGEVRLSYFMLWQVAYSEMYFTESMWPDFSQKEMQKAVDYFYSRQRRFGKSGEQIN